MRLDIHFECACGQHNASSVNCAQPYLGASADELSGVLSEDNVECYECWREFIVTVESYISGPKCRISEGASKLEYGHPYLEKHEIDRAETYDNWSWVLEATNDTPAMRFRRQIASVDQLIDLDMEPLLKFNHMVMVYGHLVAAMEGFLSAHFISLVLNSDDLMRRLVETDPELQKKSIKLIDLFGSHEHVKITVATYLSEIIFHNIKKIKPMYKSVLGYDFGDVEWLFKAVELRHDCVHRAGYDKNGKRIDISQHVVRLAMQKMKALVGDIEQDT